MPWAVAMTKPNAESIAAENLQRQGFEYFCPRYKQKKPNKTTQIRPLFPRYIFVLIQQTWYSLLGTRGISYVLRNEDGPQCLPDIEIKRLQARVGPDGLISLDRPILFTPGQAVKTVSGPLMGQNLIYDGMAPHDRVRCLLEMLGRKTPVELDEKFLVAA